MCRKNLERVSALSQLVAACWNKLIDMGCWSAKTKLPLPFFFPHPCMANVDAHTASLSWCNCWLLIFFGIPSAWLSSATFFTLHQSWLRLWAPPALLAGWLRPSDASSIPAVAMWQILWRNGKANEITCVSRFWRTLRIPRGVKINLGPFATTCLGVASVWPRCFGV